MIENLFLYFSFKLINESGEEFEKQRNKIKLGLILVNLGTIILFAISIFLKYSVIAIPVLLIWLFGNWFIMNKKEKYTKFYKESIVSKFVTLSNEKLKYRSENIKDVNLLAEYNNANFNQKQYNKYYLNNLIEGTVGDDTYLKMCNLNLQYVAYAENAKHVENIFNGMFAYTNIDKNIKSVIKINENKIKFAEEKNIVNMDNAEFEKYYDVYSEDKILTMRILTADIMEYLVEFRNKYNLKYEIIIKNNRIYLRFFVGEIFEPRIFKSAIEKEHLYKYYLITKFMIDITAKMNNVLKDIDL